MKKFFKNILRLILILFIIWFIFACVTNPSNDRDWASENEILTHYELNGDLMNIYNVRNNTYRSPLDFDSAYYDKTYDLSQIQSVDFIVAPFNPPTAHTFLSFGFEDGSHVAVSIEARREKGEFYNVFKGMLRQFEIMYVVADEADVVKLRTNYREEGDVFLYPIDTTPEKVRALFIDVMSSVNELHTKPEFYNTVVNNCTGRIVTHVNRIASEERKIGFSYKHILPAYSGELAYEMGLIKDIGEFKDIKAKYSIKEKGMSCAEAENFSACIRE